MRFIFLFFLLAYKVLNAQQSPLLTPSQKKSIAAQCRQLLSQSSALIEKNEFQSHHLANEAMNLAKKISDDSLIAVAYRTMAEAVRKKRPEVLYIYDTLFIYHAYKSKASELIFNSLQLYAFDLLNNNSIKDAVPVVKKALETADSLAIPQFQCVAYSLNAFLLFKQFKMKDASVWYKKELVLAEEHNFRDYAANAKLGIAQAIVYSGKKDSSQVLIFEVIDFYKTQKRYADAGRAFELLAFLYQVSGNMEKSLEYYKAANTFFKTAGETVLVADNHLATARILLAQKKFETAKQEIRLAETIFKSTKNLEGAALVKTHFGQYYSAIGQKDTATLFFDEARAINEKLNAPYIGLAIEISKTANEAKKNNGGKNDSLLNRTLKQAKDILPPALIDSVVNKVARRNNFNQSATSSLKQAFEGNLAQYIPSDLDTSVNPFTAIPGGMDSLVKMEYDSILLQAETKYKTRIIKDSLIIQQQLNAIQQNSITQRNRIIVSSLIAALLIVALAIQQYRNRKRAIADKNKIETLKKDADHRIANTLNTIYASIRRTKRASADKESFTLLEERVQPFKRLYEILNETHSEEIVMQPYLEEICTGLNKSYGWDRNIAVGVNAPASINGEKALRVALIVNELVTNAFKYAFENRNDGNIDVTFTYTEKDGYFLAVADDGKGMNDNKTGTGLLQIKAIAQELRARIDQQNEDGTGFEFYFM